MKPLLVVNFKCYKSGKKAVELAKACKSFVTNSNVIVVPQFTDLRAIAELKIKTFAQHVDPIEKSASTGFIDPLSIKSSGAIGTLLNHAEHRLDFRTLKKTVEICKRLKIKTLVCSPNIKESKKILKLNPDYIAFEEPDLISTGRSISEVEPEEVRKFASLFKNSNVVPLCGAGISNSLDYEKALELGTKGVLVASAIVKPKNPKKILQDFNKVH